jgi:glycosyltransferase involved in cell wall biosynthesis
MEKANQRILVLGAGPLCRNPRVLKEATALGNAGFDVTVTSIANIERFEAFDRELLVGAPFRMKVLDRLSRRPADRLAAFSERALGWLARRAVHCGVESPYCLGPYHALGRLALGIPADLTIVHTELPFCVGASLLARGRRVAADFEDWHSRDLLPAARARRPLRLLDRNERLLIQRSAYSSAPSRSMAEALHSAYGGRMPVVIPNTFPLQPAPKPLPRQNPVSFLWFSQTVGEGRGLEEFLAGWALTRGHSQVCLLGDVADSYREKLAGLVPEHRRAFLRFLPLTSPESLPGAIAEHDIGIALEPNTPESRYLTTTNKVFQYLNAGLAVLATPTAGQREILSRAPDCGLVIDLDNRESLATQLDMLLASPGRIAAMGAAAREAALRHFCWERSAPDLVAAVTGALTWDPSRK